LIVILEKTRIEIESSKRPNIWGSIMKQINKFSILGIASVVLATLLAASPVIAQAGNVGWNVSVGGGYGGGWRPAAYGPYGGGWGSGWRGNWAYGGGYYGPYAGYYAPPIAYAPPVVYMALPQPMVLAAQPQPAVWYYCPASGKYFPYIQDCPTGWQTQPAAPPTSSAQPEQLQH
jgi:hypothetical protein